MLKQKGERNMRNKVDYERVLKKIKNDKKCITHCCYGKWK